MHFAGTHGLSLVPLAEPALHTRESFSSLEMASNKAGRDEPLRRVCVAALVQSMLISVAIYVRCLEDLFRCTDYISGTGLVAGRVPKIGVEHTQGLGGEPHPGLRGSGRIRAAWGKSGPPARGE